MTTLTTEQTADLEQLAMHRAKVSEEIKNLEDIRKDLDQKILDITDESATAGAYKVIVTRSRRLDTKAIEAAFPVAQNPDFYKVAVDTDAFKKAVAENARDAYQIVGSPSIRVA